MIMLKKTHEKILGEMVESHKKEIESKNKKIEELKKQLNENEKNNVEKNNKLRTQIECNKLVLNSKENELKEINNRLIQLKHQIGGFTSASKKIKEKNLNLEKENKKLKDLLDLAEKEIADYVKPTKQEARYSTMRLEKGKLVDHERKNKKEQIKKVQNEIKDKRKEFEGRLANALKRPLQIEQKSKKEFVIKEQN